MRNNPFDAPGTFFKGNIHSHSTGSDGLLPAGEVVEAYRERGYDFVAVTDHFLPRYGGRLTDTTPFRSTGTFTTLIGAEMHAPGLQNGFLWDLLAVGLPLDFEPRRPNESAWDLIGRAHATGAFTAIPHPAWNGVVHRDAVGLMGVVDAIEIHNEGHTLDSDRGNGWMLADSLATAGHRVSTFAADDAHFKSDRFDRFGGWIHVRAEELSPEVLLAALKRGEYYASTGPKITNVIVGETTITVECELAVGIMLGGAGTARTYLRGEGLTEATFPRTLFEGGFFRVNVIAADGAKAWTSPIWLDEAE